MLSRITPDSRKNGTPMMAEALTVSNRAFVHPPDPKSASAIMSYEADQRGPKTSLKPIESLIIRREADRGRIAALKPARVKK
jgi:hypothetical protein